MPKIKVYNLDRQDVGELDLSEAVFGSEVNESLLYEVVKAQRASARAGTSAVRNRSMVAGTTKKVYRQKGTGNARHGSTKAPNYVGGGVAHGPKVRSYAYRPPRKMRIGALKSALSLKLKEGRLIVVNDFELKDIKTKALAQVLGRLEVGSSAVIVDAKDNEKLRMSARNLPSHQFLPPEGVNIYDVLRHDHLVLTQKAVEALEARCNGAGGSRRAAGAEPSEKA